VTRIIDGGRDAVVAPGGGAAAGVVGRAETCGAVSQSAGLVFSISREAEVNVQFKVIIAPPRKG
jgi:hypothetical protein